MNQAKSHSFARNFAFCFEKIRSINLQHKQLVTTDDVWQTCCMHISSLYVHFYFVYIYFVRLNVLFFSFSMLSFTVNNIAIRMNLFKKREIIIIMIKHNAIGYRFIKFKSTYVFSLCNYVREIHILWYLDYFSPNLNFSPNFYLPYLFIF